MNRRDLLRASPSLRKKPLDLAARNQDNRPRKTLPLSRPIRWIKANWLPSRFGPLNLSLMKANSPNFASPPLQVIPYLRGPRIAPKTISQPISPGIWDPYLKGKIPRPTGSLFHAPLAISPAYPFERRARQARQPRQMCLQLFAKSFQEKHLLPIERGTNFCYDDRFPLALMLPICDRRRRRSVAGCSFFAG